MIKPASNYFARLLAVFGAGWTRFWFTPSDPSMISAMRLAVGFVALYLHATLSFDLIAFFGPDGLLPAADISPLEGGTFSYLNFLSTPGELWTVHLLGLTVLALFAMGLWTHVTSILSLVVFLSDVNRAPMITGTTEPVVAMLLLYLCLAPCGRYYSIDRLLADRRGGTSRLGQPVAALSTWATIATRLIQVHLALWVAMMGFSKLTGDTWWTGTGAWWLIAREDSRLIDLTWLHTAPGVVEFITHLIVLFELSFPLLIWIPLARPLMLGLALVVWTFLGLVTGDVMFALVMATASMAYVPPEALRSCCVRSAAPAAKSA